ncbi:MAG TPA: nuclear transport factor 2 family protein [Polyangia bacterium]
MNKLTDPLIAVIVSAASLIPFAAMAAQNDDAQIRALEARFAKAVAAKDIGAVMKVYSPHVFVFDVVPPRQYVGAVAYREDWKGLFAGFAGPVKMQISDLVVSTDGMVGYGHSIQRVSGVDPKGKPVDLTVRVTDVYRKQAGAWSIVQEHVSVPVDLDTGKADLTSKP